MAGPALEVLQGPVIDAGQSLSQVLSLGTDYIIGLVMPEEWTPAVVSFQVSPQGDNYYDVFDPLGREFVFNVIPGTIIKVDPDLLMMAAFIRIRSGTRSQPVPQEKMRRFFTIGKQTVSMAASTPTSTEE